MAALWQQFAKQAIDENKEALNKLPVEQRKEVIKSTLLRYRQNPSLKIDPSQVKPEVQQRLGALEKASQDRFQEKGVSATAQSEFKKTARIAELQAQGVDLDQEIPFEDSWKLGFGVNPDKELKAALSKHYGQDVRLVRDVDDYIYMNPETKRLTRANLGIAASAGQGIPMAFDVAGTYGAGKTSPAGAVAGAVIRETVGSGAFTTLGEGIRLGIGKALGVHDLSWDEISKLSAEKGAEAAAFTGGVGSVVAGAKGTYNFIKGGLFTTEEAAKYGLTVEEANQIIDEVNKIVQQGGGKGKVKSTLAQKADDVNLASMEQEARASQEHGQRFSDRTKQDQQAAAEAVDIINRPPHMVEQGATDVADIAKQRVQQRTARAEQYVAKNEQELASQLDKIKMTGTPKTQVGEPTADYIKLKYDAAKQAKDMTWDNVAKIGGFDEATKSYGIKIPQGDLTKKLKGEFYRRTKTAQTKIAAGGTGAVFKEEPKKFKGKIVKPKPQDLYDLNREISDLKRELSNLRSGKARGTTAEKDLVEVIDAMQKDRAEFLIKNDRKDVLSAIESAEKQTHQFHETYKRSVIGDLMEKNENGVAKIRQADFVDDMLKRDDDEIAQFTDVIGDNLDLHQKWRDGMADAWKRKVFDSKGKYSPVQNARFFEDHENALQYFLTSDEIMRMKKAGNFADKIAQESKDLEKFVNRANAKWGSGTLSRVDPEGLSNFITGKGGSWTDSAGTGISERISKIKYVKNMTAKAPAAWRKVQNDFKRQIKGDVLDAKTGYISPTKLANWVADDQNARVVKEMLGTKYYDDLVSINEVVKILNKKENRLVKSQAVKGTIQAVRAGVAPPLTARGRILTSVLTFHNREAQARMADTLLDEKSMRNIGELLKHNKNTRQFYEKAASLGFMIPDDNEE